MNKKIIFIVIVSLLIGGVGGYVYGAQQALHWCVGFGLKFVDIEVNQPMLEQAIFQYKNQIGGCLFAENKSASILP